MTQEEVHSTITADDVAISMHSGQEGVLFFSDSLHTMIKIFFNK